MKNTINLVNSTYAQTGTSTKTNELGMREMQARAFEKRNAPKLLIKAPPASGKSRALMFIALDKLHNQGIKKAIIAVPEKSIGASFRNTELSKFGFFADWKVDSRNNLCLDDKIEDSGKVAAFERFMESDDRVLLCTHATLRFAFEKVSTDKFNNCLLAIDEFHHASTYDNRLGDLLRDVIKNSNAHIIAMTGSYFRGDNVPILTPEDENNFEKITYTYYEQLNGYTYLKSLGIGYHFYTGSYLSEGALDAVLDTSKKTIIHIPNVNSKESTQQGKHEEVSHIFDILGDWQEKDKDEIDIIKSRNGKILRVANLVDDDPKHREILSRYLSKVAQDDINAVDIIIALNMAKEGFDWPFCEHALTIGYRSSLTEIVQIIGRCTRDSFNKTKAQFTNLIVSPNGTRDEVVVATNDLLKAITASLLMEQVLAPEFKFTPREIGDNAPAKPGEIKIKGLPKVKEGSKIKKIIENDLHDLTAKTLQDSKIQQASARGDSDPEYIKARESIIIRQQYPDLNDDEVEIVRKYMHAQMVIKTNPPQPKNNSTEDDPFLRVGNKFININEIDINLIDSINPFSQSFEVISRQVDADIFKQIKLALDSSKIELSEAEVLELIPELMAFLEANDGRPPEANSTDKHEKLMYQIFAWLSKNHSKYEDK